MALKSGGSKKIPINAICIELKSIHSDSNSPEKTEQVKDKVPNENVPRVFMRKSSGQTYKEMAETDIGFNTYNHCFSNSMFWCFR